jgi:hypothetical protein
LTASRCSPRSSEIVKRIQDPEERKAALGELYGEMSARISQMTNKAALGNRNSIALTVLTGARGKENQLRDLITTPGFYQDGRGKTIPGYIRNSFAEGLRPADYLAGTYAARSAVTEAKKAVAKGGFMSKTLARAAATTYVSEEDCGTSNGIDLPKDEPDLIGRVLQRPIGTHKAGSLIDRKLLRDIQDGKDADVIVRSPMTCQAKHGICGRCFGLKAEGKFPKIGDHVGVTASNALGEPLAQGALNCLKSGTYVRMADLSTRKIEDIEPGEWVLGSDKAGTTFPVQVLSKWDQGLQPVQRYTYAMARSRKNSITLECTEIHELLSAVPGEDFKKLPAGIRGRHVSAAMPVTADLGFTLVEPYAELCGVLLGDGIRWDPEQSRAPVRISCADPKLIKDLDVLLDPLECRLTKEKRSFDYSISRTREAYLANPSKNPIKAKMVEWGLAGCYALTKRVPPVAWKWNDASLGALIAGFIATDGSVGKATNGGVFVSFASTSKGLLEDIKELMAVRLCVYGNEITRIGKAGTGNRKNDMWAFMITVPDQLAKLSTAIGRIPGCKGDLFTGLVAGDTRAHNPRVLARRKKIEELGVAQTWDLSVDHPDQLFVLANGLVISNTKHITSASGPKSEFSGLDYLGQFTESPEEFKDKAIVASVAGRVGAIEVAPQGGHYVTVGEARHYVPLDRVITTAPGDELEAGDVMTDGLAEAFGLENVFRIGEARSYWASKMAQIAKASGAGMDRRLFETLARANVDHVTLDDPLEEGFLPDDKVRYSEWVQRRQPSAKTFQLGPNQAIGKYLEAPALHHTVGTKVTPRMAEHLSSRGFNQVHVSDDSPGFTPTFIRLQQVAATDDDWLASQGASYLGNQLREGIGRAQDTNIEINRHPVPRLAIGINYADKLEETGMF